MNRVPAIRWARLVNKVRMTEERGVAHFRNAKSLGYDPVYYPGYSSRGTPEFTLRNMTF
jgi:hypothetical protein